MTRAPLVLPPNQLSRFYRGGGAIARFRGLAPGGNDGPEDWVGAVSTVFGEGELGLARLEDGTFVRDAIAADPAGFLGPGHDSPELLVKLLDAGERLPVHCHPDDEFARRELGARHGKTEAWAIVETRGPAVVGLGFRDEVDAETLAGWVETQDVAAMLAALNELPVAPGDVVYVPAGVPHAIGEGILLVELQEPSDFSILLEWEGFALDGRRDGHVGIGYERALRAVDRSGWGGRVERLVRHDDGGSRTWLLPPAAEPFFGAERLRPEESVLLEPAFSILVVLGGSGALECEQGSVGLERGRTVLVPHGAGPTTVRGRVDAIRCLPPYATRSPQR